MGRDADLSPSLALVLSMHNGPRNLQYTGRIGHTSFDKRYFDRNASTPLTQGFAIICLSTSSCRHPHLCLMLREYKITLPLSISSNKGTAHFTTLPPMSPFINFRITRRDRQDYQALTPGNSRSSPPTTYDHQLVLAVEQILLQQWRLLASQGLRSIDQQQLAALVDNEGNREIVLNFRGKDAATVINTIDKVSRF